MDNEGKIDSSLNQGIGTISFYHPRSNSLPGKLLNALAGEFEKFSHLAECMVIVLKSEGNKAFCAGASFDELLSIKNLSEGKEFFMGFARVINAMRKCSQFIIARIQGKIVGGGVGLASAADYVLALDSASVRLSELTLGIGPFVISAVVERKIGKSALGEMALDTEWKSPEWAVQKGLYNKLLPSIEDLDKAVNALASKLAASNPRSMVDIKKMLWRGTENWDELLEQEAEISSKHALSEYTIKHINEFKKGSERP
ncbi:MAG: enoyl-CoA hydratase/isomerase family protein [bacterium]